jgi:hypothetical protein
LEFFEIADSVTDRVTTDPAGITAPLVPVTSEPSVAVKVSPALCVLVHMRAAVRTAKEVPAAMVPVRAAGALVGVVVAGRGAGAFVTGAAGAGAAPPPQAEMRATSISGAKARRIVFDDIVVLRGVGVLRCDSKD